jgi:nickel-dependent lactate racemase
LNDPQHLYLRYKNSNYFSISISGISNELGFTGGRRVVVEGVQNFESLQQQHWLHHFLSI